MHQCYTIRIFLFYLRSLHFQVPEPVNLVAEGQATSMSHYLLRTLRIYLSPWDKGECMRRNRGQGSRHIFLGKWKLLIIQERKQWVYINIIISEVIILQKHVRPHTFCFITIRAVLTCLTAWIRKDQLVSYCFRLKNFLWNFSWDMCCDGKIFHLYFIWKSLFPSFLPQAQLCQVFLIGSFFLSTLWKYHPIVLVWSFFWKKYPESLRGFPLYKRNYFSFDAYMISSLISILRICLKYVLATSSLAWSWLGSLFELHVPVFSNFSLNLGSLQTWFI
jgi:hypothetical protein